MVKLRPRKAVRVPPLQLQHNAATHCSTLGQGPDAATATQYKTLQHTLNAVQRNITHCNAMQHNGQADGQSRQSPTTIAKAVRVLPSRLQHTATHTEHTATHCDSLRRTATHCNTLHHTATHCTTLHHDTPHCYTLGQSPTVVIRWQIHTATHAATHTATHTATQSPTVVIRC